MKAFLRKIALACAVICGLAAASCQVDPVTTTFVNAPAEAVVKVLIKSSVTGEDISADAVLRYWSNDYRTQISSEGNVITLKSKGALRTQVLTLSASSKGQVSAITPLTITSIPAGGKEEYVVTLKIDPPVPPTPEACATIRYNVVEIHTGVDITATVPVTASAEYGTPQAGASNTYYLYAAEGGIRTQYVYLRASYNGKEYTKAVGVYGLYEGENSSYDATIYVGE